ncbi:hypothetical protein Tco_1509676 [Tanacetum coccineum]
MSTSKTYQQSLADTGSETRPPMLRRGSYMPWASRFRRYINRKRKKRKWLNKALDEDEYQQDDVHTNFEDPLTSSILLVARAITQIFSTPTNNRLRTSSNTETKPNHSRRQVNIKQETLNDFLFADTSRMEEIEELSANICLMARIQQADNTYDVGPSYDSAFINLEAKLKKNVDIILKLGNSLQGMFKLEPKPLSVYDQQLKHGNSKISLNVKDNEDTPDDASKSQQRVNGKMNDPIAVANKQNFRKTRFSKESTLSKSLDTTHVVSKPKIDVGSTSKANDKVVQIVLWIVDSGCSKHMTGDRSLLKKFIEKFMGTVRFVLDIISLALDNFVMAI